MSAQPPKNPQPSASDFATNRTAVFAALDAAGPVAPVPPAVYGGYPQPDDVDRCFAVEGVTTQQVSDAYVKVGQYGGKFSSTDFTNNSYLRTGNFVTNKWLSEQVARSFELGLPLPTEADSTNPPLIASFSESELERRAALNPPQKYNGDVAYKAADAAIWEPQITSSLLAMASDKKWSVINPDAQLILAKNMAGKGLPYEVPKGSDGTFNQYQGLNAAQILRIADPATLPGVPASA